MVLLGGSRKNHGTADFLGLAPENLSTGFRLQGVFGVDYRHQSVSTEVIPTKMTEAVKAGLNKLLGDGELVHVRVELAEAGASAINYAVIADVAGSVASKYRLLQRALQRLCVEACNTHGWTIPFTQITLHQAIPENTGTP